jgi:acetylornithine deacetylase
MDALVALLTGVERLSNTLAARFGKSPERIGVAYWTESALWAGIPTVICGPAGGGMHSDDEWVDLRQVSAYAEALTETIRAYCGPAAG